MLAQYVASRSCKMAVDEADTALRGALQRLTVSHIPLPLAHSVLIYCCRFVIGTICGVDDSCIAYYRSRPGIAGRP